MVDIGRCSSCGTYTSEVWSKKDNCQDCGGSMDHMTVRLGPMEMAPRTLNISGAVVFLAGLVIFLVSISQDSPNSGHLYFMFTGILLFVISLGLQYHLVKKAIEKRSSMSITPKKRRNMEPGRTGPVSGNIRKGPGEKRVAKKVMVRK